MSRSACGTYVSDKKCLKVLVRKPEGKIPLGIPGHRWVRDIKMDLKEI
jgi:hypothetical protein